MAISFWFGLILLCVCKICFGGSISELPEGRFLGGDVERWWRLGGCIFGCNWEEAFVLVFFWLLIDYLAFWGSFLVISACGR